MICFVYRFVFWLISTNLLLVDELPGVFMVEQAVTLVKTFSQCWIEVKKKSETVPPWAEKNSDRHTWANSIALDHL